MKEVDEQVDAKSKKVTDSISETSVTILGIFAGIIITFVAGFSYSASVLESVRATNYFKLLSVAGLIGLICYHLISLLFRFIIRIREPDSQSFKWNKRDKIITGLLIVFIFVMGALQYVPCLNQPVEKVDNVSVNTFVEFDNDENREPEQTEHETSTK